MAIVELRQLKKELKELLNKGFIHPSISLWGTLILFMRKKDGSLQTYINYRQLNKVMVNDKSLFLRIHDLFDLL